jgi:hypothetical protein
LYFILFSYVFAPSSWYYCTLALISDIWSIWIDFGWRIEDFVHWSINVRVSFSCGPHKCNAQKQKIQTYSEALWQIWKPTHNQQLSFRDIFIQRQLWNILDPSWCILYPFLEGIETRTRDQSQGFQQQTETTVECHFYCCISCCWVLEFSNPINAQAAERP